MTWKDGGFLRMWKMPEKEFAQRIEAALEKAGWHEFFEPGTRGARASLR